MSQYLGFAFIFSLLAGTFIVYMQTKAQRRDVDLLIKYSEGPESRSFLLYKALTLQTQHAFHLLLSLVTAGGWLIPWWGLTMAQSALRRQLEDAAAKTLHPR